MDNQITDFLTELGFAKQDRLPFWNPVDDNPRLDHYKYALNNTKGMVKVNFYIAKGNWPNYLCAGDSLKNKFSACLQTKEKLITIADLVEISKENLELILGQFR